MKELIIEALDSAYEKFIKTIPLTKNQTEYVNIQDVEPMKLSDFMKENDIPETAWFGGKPNGYDSFDEICLCYDIEVPTTEKEKETYRKEKFRSYAWHSVYDKLMKENNGYKRVGYNTGLLRQFDDTTVYEMYMAKDFDRLLAYYSLPFSKTSPLI